MQVSLLNKKKNQPKQLTNKKYILNVFTVLEERLFSIILKINCKDGNKCIFRKTENMPTECYSVKNIIYCP